jgi:AcrR family transcriptional regulator
MRSTEERATAEPAASERILRAAIGELVSLGAGELAMHDVADRAGVSKGLIHYHYRDKEALLARAADRLGTRIAARAQRALSGSTADSVVEDLRRWLDTELEIGEWRALLSLAEFPAPAVQQASGIALEARRLAASRMMARFFAVMDLRPRVAPELLGELWVALVGGLAMEADAAHAAGPAFDVLVLALLGLAADRDDAAAGETPLRP